MTFWNEKFDIQLEIEWIWTIELMTFIIGGNAKKKKEYWGILWIYGSEIWHKWKKNDQWMTNEIGWNMTEYEWHNEMNRYENWQWNGKWQDPVCDKKMTRKDIWWMDKGLLFWHMTLKWKEWQLQWHVNEYDKI